VQKEIGADRENECREKSGEHSADAPKSSTT